MRGAVKRSFAETAKKGDGILNMLELSDSIKGATTEQPHRHAHSFPNRLTLNKSPFHPVHAVVQSHLEQAQPVSCLPDTHVSTLAIATFSHRGFAKIITQPEPVAHGHTLFRSQQLQRKPAQIEEVANYSHENQTPEPFFERKCFQCHSDGRESHRELPGREASIAQT